MKDELEDIRAALRTLSASLSDVIGQAFHAHKLAERTIATAKGIPLDPLADAHIEESKRIMIQQLQKVNERLRG